MQCKPIWGQLTATHLEALASITLNVGHLRWLTNKFYAENVGTDDGSLSTSLTMGHIHNQPWMMVHSGSPRHNRDQ